MLIALALRHGNPGQDRLAVRSLGEPAPTAPPALPRAAVEPTATPTPTLTPTPESTEQAGDQRPAGSSHPAETRAPSAGGDPSATGVPTPTPRPTGSEPTPTATASPSPSPTEHSTTIVISGYAFSPGTLRIRVGETVTVINQDVDDHDLTSDEWSTGNLHQGDSQQHTFNAPGQYDYLCSIHTGMTGTIIVS